MKLRSYLIFAAFVALAMPLWADGVARSVEPVAGGCKVTLAWNFSGKVESGLVIEERFPSGWSVVDSTVPFGSLDASWFSCNVARFAVKPSLLSEAGSITFTVAAADGAAEGSVSGDWKMYLSGSLVKGGIVGAGVQALASGDGAAASGGSGGTETNGTLVETAVAIKSFNILGDSIMLTYSGVAKAGTLVVEGCEGLGKAWTEVKRTAVGAGDGSVVFGADDASASRFFRLKLLTEE